MRWSPVLRSVAQLYESTHAPLMLSMFHRIVLFEVDTAKLFKEQHTAARAALHTGPAPESPLMPSQSHRAPGNKAVLDHTRGVAASSSGMPCGNLCFD